MAADIYEIKECPDCASMDIIHNDRRQQIICKSCGLIYEPLTPQAEEKYLGYLGLADKAPKTAKKPTRKKTATKKKPKKSTTRKKSAKKAKPKKKSSKKPTRKKKATRKPTKPKKKTKKRR